MDVRIGFALWTLADIPLEDTLPTLARMGYQGIELVGDPERFPVEQVRPAMTIHGLEVVAVTLPPELDLAHPLPSLRHDSLAQARDLIGYCVAVGCPRLVVRERVGRMRPIVGRQREWTLFQQSVANLLQAAVGTGVRIAVLPVNRYEGYLLNTAADALALLQRLDPLRVELALNTYHMNVEEADLLETLREAASRLGLLYAAENHRHAIGQGHLDWVALCQALHRHLTSLDLVVECQAPGADPLLPIGRDPRWPQQVLTYAEESIRTLRVILAALEA